MSKIKNRTVVEGRKLVSKWEQSGLSQYKFAKQCGVSVAVLRYWQARIGTLDKKPVKQKPVHFLKVVEKSSQLSREVRLFVPGGLMIETSDLPSPEYVAELSIAYQRRLPC